MRLLRHFLVVVITTLPVHAVIRAATFVVDPAGGGDFLAIQPAVDAATAGDTILVRPGTYSEAVYVAGAKNGLLIRGDGPVDDILVTGDAYIVARIDQTTVPVRIQGLTLSGSGQYGALWIQNAKAEIVGCVIRDNNGPGGCHGVGAAGRFIFSSDVLVQGCLIEDNHDWESPGGLIVWQARADIRDNVFRNNSACYGGGLEMYHCEGYGTSVIEKNLFVNNRADVWGGGLFNVDSSPIIRFNTFVDNGDSLQAAIWVLGGKPSIESNLLVGSHWATYCQTDAQYPPSLPVIGDNLCWEIGDEVLSNCAAPGNLKLLNPLLCNAQAGDYHLCADSPAAPNGTVIYGAFDVGCPDCGGTPVRRATMGSVKALYRDRKPR